MSDFREALKDGNPRLGLCVMYPSPGALERIGGDWDWIWIDGQHGQLGYQDVLALVRACGLVQRPAFVRAPGHEFGAIGLALDTGADGLIVPLVENAEEARSVARAAKFPPVGMRSYGGRRPIDLKGRNYSDTANSDVILVAQIESPEAVENAEAIAATPGVDALFLGPDDIMLRRGYSMTSPRNKESLGKDMEAVAKACAKHGKIPVMVGVGLELLELCVSMGYKMIVAGGDVPFLANTSKQAAADARKVLHGLKASSASKEGKGPASPY